MTREQRQKNQERKQNDFIRDSYCWEEQLSNDEYLDHLDRKLYQRSQYAR